MNKRLSFILGGLVLLATFLFFCFQTDDADLGWHLRYGEYFLKTGTIMRDNQFSWMVPHYQWANHSWGFDVIAAILFGQTASRFWLLSLSAALVVMLSIWLVHPHLSSTADILAIGVYVYFGEQLLNNGLRSQSFSLLFTAILWQILTHYIRDQQTKLTTFLPLLFLVWANIHGQFVYGLGILGLFLLIKVWEDHSIKAHGRLIFISFISGVISLINPWGFQLWIVASNHLNNPALNYVYEWLPWELNTVRMWALLSITAVLWWHIYTKRITYPRALVWPLLCLTVMAIFSRRIIAYYLLVALMPLTEVFKVWLKKRTLPKHTNIVIIAGFAVLAVIGVSKRNIFNQSWDTYCQGSVYCSEKAVQFIRDHHLQGKLFNAYRLGGYLDYRLPEMKTMIDGRMTVWVDENGRSPYLDYTSMVFANSGSRNMFYTIDPDYVLLQPAYTLAQVLIKTENWPVIYADNQVLLFENPKYFQASRSATLK